MNKTHVTNKEELIGKKCKPCEGGVEPLSPAQAQEFSKELNSNWKISKDHKIITREFKFKNYKSAWDFVNEVSVIAESENHHPDLVLKWGYVRVDMSTHAINGLSENDFIIAAKIDNV